jgi:glycosyltransferase involved in cell wall biosynthesis
MSTLRIAQIAPLFESVPPQAYGGTERIVSYLTEELVALGHDVTLFASGDSQTNARLVPVREAALRLDPAVRDWVPHHVILLEHVMRRSAEFDVIHFHTDILHMPFTRRLSAASVTTLHGRLDLPDLVPFYGEFADAAVVSISEAQRCPLPAAKWVGNVYHGLPLDLYRPGTGAGGYLAFLGRISPEKRPDSAIEIAKRAGLPLKIAAKVDAADLAYFERHIEPLLDHPLVEFIGEVSDRDKQEFLANATALLFPIDWPEPFGLVMIEAMACGTPVIARRRGSVPEVMRHGTSGYLFEELEEAVSYARRLDGFDRARCRRYFEENFSARRMALDYVDLYRELAGPSSGDAEAEWLRDTA